MRAPERTRIETGPVRGDEKGERKRFGGRRPEWIASGEILRIRGVPARAHARVGSPSCAVREESVLRTTAYHRELMSYAHA
jgi:hypothetical protein